MQFGPLTCAWQSLGESGEARSGEARSRETETEILDVLADLGKVQAHTIAKTLGKDYSNKHKIIAWLSTAGKVGKEMIEGKAFYFLPQEKDK